MPLLNWLTKSPRYKTPEECPDVYVLFHDTEKVYGPYTIEDLAQKSWHERASTYRFEGESKWHDFTLILMLLEKLPCSRRQVGFFQQEVKDINPDDFSFIRAIHKIEEVKRTKRAEEKARKENLPITKQSLNKLTAAGVDASPEMTRKEGKQLLDEVNLLNDTKEILIKLEKQGFKIPYRSNKLSLGNVPEDIYLLVDRLMTGLDLLREYGVSSVSKEFGSFDSLSAFVDRLEEAEHESEDLIDQLDDRELSTDGTTYKVSGSATKAQKNSIKKHVIEAVLDGSWDAEDNAEECISLYAPKVKLRELEY